MKKEHNTNVHREYKSRLFTMIFSQKKELLELYNAVNGSQYTDPELLEINTLENAIYMSIKNDLSFVIDMSLNLYEHQSTYNPNIPLRSLFYISDLLSAMTQDENLYGRVIVQIPTPRFLVFYNGTEERPETEILKLSDLYKIKEGEKSLELIVTVLNINSGYNVELMESCKTLKDYCVYNQRIREYLESMPLEDAVEHTITECIHEGILADFLKRNRAEAMKMSIYEFDEELYKKQQEREMKMLLEQQVKQQVEQQVKQQVEQQVKQQVEQILQRERQDSIKQGRQEGRQQGIKQGRQEGIECLALLIAKMLEDNRMEDVARVSSDVDYRNRLMMEYQII